MISNSLLVATAIAALQAAPVPTSQETEFRAAMIYNFARFATWQSSRFSDAAAPVVLCVSPSNKLASSLSRLQGRPVGTRKLAVRQTDNPGASCHLAVLTTEASGPGVVAGLNNQGVLTVGETPGFARNGAVGLVTVGRQTRFEVNSKAARDGGVALSSQLLRLAVAVR